MMELLKKQCSLVVVWIVMSLFGINVGFLAVHRPFTERLGCVFFLSIPLIAGMLGTYVESRFDRDEYVDMSESDLDESELESKKPQEARKEDVKTGS